MRPWILVSLLVVACKDDVESSKTAAGEAGASRRKAEAKSDPSDAARPTTESKAGAGPKLPPAPALPKIDVPAQYPDGAWSIVGLREDLERRLAAGDDGEEIDVRGLVVEVSKAKLCPLDDACGPEGPPYVVLADRPDVRGPYGTLKVVEHHFAIPAGDAARWAAEPQVVLEVGKRYTVRGKFGRFSDRGTHEGAGLLQFSAYRPLDPATGEETTDWVAPPGAPWHRLERARNEAALAELEAAAAAAEAQRGR